MAHDKDQAPTDRVWRRKKRPEMKPESNISKILFLLAVSLVGIGYWSLKRTGHARPVAKSTDNQALAPAPTDGGSLRAQNEPLFQEVLSAPDIKLAEFRTKIWPILDDTNIPRSERHLLAKSVLRVLAEVEETSKESGPKLSAQAAKLRFEMFLEAFVFLLKTRADDADPAEIARPHFVYAAPINHETIYQTFYSVVGSSASLSQLREGVGIDKAASKAAATGN